MDRYYTYSSLEQVGRLGNQLYQLAWLIGCADKKRAIPALKPNWSYRPFFNIPDQFYLDPPSGVEIIDGGREYYQDLAWFSHCENAIRHYFQPSQRAHEYLVEHYESWLLDPDVHKTSIHLRRGDYLKTPQHFPIPTDKYYNAAISEALNICPDTTFVVFSDDYEYARAKFPDYYVVKGDIVSPDPEDRPKNPMDWPDLFLQTEASTHIIANSTYSWWGAFLSAENQAFYPSVFWGPALSTTDWRLMIPKQNWTKITC